MKVGDLVRCTCSQDLLVGIIVELDPFEDGLHTRIFWTDKDEPGGTIESVWANEDIEVIL